jgi:hypothetical protein
VEITKLRARTSGLAFFVAPFVLVWGGVHEIVRECLVSLANFAFIAAILGTLWIFCALSANSA